MAVTRQWSQDQFQRGESAEQVYWVDAADENIAGFAAGVPQQNTSHLRDLRLLAQIPVVRPLMIGTLYEVRVQYVRLRTGQEQQQEHLLDTPPTIWWQIGSSNEPVWADADGNPFINSVGDGFQGLTEDFPTLHLTYTQYESVYDIQKALAYGNKTNSDSFTIRGPNGPMVVFPGQALCHSITSQPYAINAEAVPVSYNIEFREDLFQRRLVDEGYNGYYDDSGTPRKDRLVNGKGEFLITPARLKNGKPIDTNFKVGTGNKTPINVSTIDHNVPPKGATVENKDGVSFLIYKRKKSIAFSGLGL